MTAAGVSPSENDPPAWPLPPRRPSMNADSSSTADGKGAMVIDMTQVSDPSESFDSPVASGENGGRADSAGTEILGWIASAPLFVVLLLRVAKAVSHAVGNENFAKYANIASQQRFFMAVVWYLCVLSIETGLRWSPTLMHIISASRDDNTRQLISKFTDADTVRLETHMTCYRETKDNPGVSTVSWTGKSKFDCSLVTDNTIFPGDVQEKKAVLIEFGSSVEFADPKSRSHYDKHVEAFERKNTSHGDTFTTRHVLVIPGLDGRERLSYSDPSRVPLRASLVGFAVCSLLGLTVPYRLAMKSLVPSYRITIVKRVWTTRSRRTRESMCDRYPSVNYGA